MPEELVSDLPIEDAENLCEERDGDFVIRRGEIYVVWENDGNTVSEENWQDL